MKVSTKYKHLEVNRKKLVLVLSHPGNPLYDIRSNILGLTLKGGKRNSSHATQDYKF